MLNKIMIIGHLGKDPESRSLNSGGTVTNFSVATSEKWKDKKTGSWEERTEWHNVVFFGRIAEVCEEYLHKGSKVYVEGSVRTEKWEDQDGNPRYTTKVYGQSMKMLDGKGGSGRASQPASESEKPAAYAGIDEPDDDVVF